MSVLIHLMCCDVMKVRMGFVSNSSSSSFVIFGKCFTRDEFQKRCKFTDEEMETIDEEGMYDFEDNLGGLDYVYLNEDNEWILGCELFGDASNIIKTISHVDTLFGSGCKIYRGVNNTSTGEIQLDSGA